MGVVLLILCSSINMQGQEAERVSPMVEFDLAHYDTMQQAEQKNLVLDNPLGVPIGMVQILDIEGRLIDATIIRSLETRVEVENIFVPAGNYVLVFNTMLGFSFVQEITRAEF